MRSRALGALRRLPYREYHIVRSTCRKSVLSARMKKNKILRHGKDGKRTRVLGMEQGRGSDGQISDPSTKKGERRESGRCLGNKTVRWLRGNERKDQGSLLGFCLAPARKGSSLGVLLWLL